MKSASSVGKLTQEDLTVLRTNSKENGIYKSHKDQLKKSYFDTINHPEEHGYVGEVANNFRELAANDSDAKMGWRVAKSTIKNSLNELSEGAITELLVKDLEDSRVAVNNVYALRAIIKHPENPDFNLEPEMVEYITNLHRDTEAKNALLECLSNAKGLEVNDNVLFHESRFSKFAEKLKDGASHAWEQLSPIVKALAASLAEIGFNMLSSLIVSAPALADQPQIKESLNNAVDKGGDAIVGMIREGITPPSQSLLAEAPAEESSLLGDDMGANQVDG